MPSVELLPSLQHGDGVGEVLRGVGDRPDHVQLVQHDVIRVYVDRSLVDLRPDVDHLAGELVPERDGQRLAGDRVRAAFIRSSSAAGAAAGGRSRRP
jgi:hypothetical protein